MSAELGVQLLHHAPLTLAILAARKCYRTTDRMDSEHPSDDIGPADTKRIRSIIANGHESVIEHVNYTSDISGISRACSHQLVRHRIASVSQESQRYIDMDGFDYVVPPDIAGSKEACSLFLAAMADAQRDYSDLRALETDDGHPLIKGEDARFVLPNAAATSLIMTFNARSLRNFFNLRTDSHAQWEIQALAHGMASVLPHQHMIMFDDVIHERVNH